MSEKDDSLLSADELAAIEDMVASGQLDSDIFNANVEANPLLSPAMRKVWGEAQLQYFKLMNVSTGFFGTGS